MTSAKKVAADIYAVVSRRLPLDSSLAVRDAFVVSAVRAVNDHSHTQTCAKGGRRGDDKDCRLNLPLCLVPYTCLLNDATFAVRRTVGTVVPYVYGLMLAYPANHVMRLTCEGGAWLRHLLLWREAVAESPKNREVRSSRSLAHRRFV